MKKPLIINIQKFSVHDGDGIRTTVFFKGCPLSCRWCHNAESRSWNRELMFFSERCSGCGRCAAVCPEKGIAVKEQEGGVTLSGGEAMAQDMDYMENLLVRLQSEGIPVNMDTCGEAPFERFERVLPYIHTFLYDIKAVTPELHREYTGVSNERILENLKNLTLAGARVHIRVPVIPEVNGDDEEMGKIMQSPLRSACCPTTTQEKTRLCGLEPRAWNFPFPRESGWRS